MEQKPSIGRIVIVHPGEGKDATPLNLPNGMEVAPAIVTQIFNGDYLNLTAFIDDGIQGTRCLYTVPHKSNAVNGQYYWDWPARV